MIKYHTRGKEQIKIIDIDYFAEFLIRKFHKESPKYKSFLEDFYIASTVTFI